MTIFTLTLALLIATAALVALTSAVVRGDGRIGPGRAPAPPRSHPADVFETAMRRFG